MKLAQEVEIFFSYDFHSNTNARRFCRARGLTKRFKLKLKLKQRQQQKAKPKPIPTPTPKPAKPTTDSLTHTHTHTHTNAAGVNTLTHLHLWPSGQVSCAGTKSYFVLVSYVL